MHTLVHLKNPIFTQNTCRYSCILPQTHAHTRTRARACTRGSTREAGCCCCRRLVGASSRGAAAIYRLRDLLFSLCSSRARAREDLFLWPVPHTSYSSSLQQPGRVGGPLPPPIATAIRLELSLKTRGCYMGTVVCV